MHLTVTGGRMHKVSRSLLFASIVALGGLAACGDDVTVAGPATGTGTVTVSPSPVTIAVNGTINMVADLGGAAVGQAVTWSSSNAAIATVDASSGLVTGKAPGSVAITAKTTGNFSGSATVTVATGSTSQQAQVSILSITKGGLQQPVQLNNVSGQIDVTLNVDPGGQNVEKVELVMIDSLTGAEKVVASQTIVASGSVASNVDGLSLSMAKTNAQAVAALAANVPQQIVLSFNTASFDPVTGAVAFINGRKLVRARLVLGTGSSQDQVASNTVAINLNNTDGFYIVQTPLNSIADRPQPNSATDGGGLVWYQAGKGIEARTVPVMYSGRTVKTRTIQFDGVGSTKTITSGAPSTDTIAVGISTAFGRVRVLGAVATDGNPINMVSNIVGGIDVTAGAINGQPIGSNSNETIGVRLDSIRVDNVSPSVSFSIAATNPNNWVNGSYNFLQSGNLSASDAPGVGLSGSFPYGAMFEYSGCPDTTYTASTTGTGADIPECATDLTNLAYNGRVIVKDKLGNATTTSPVSFGVDKTAPVITWLTPGQDSSVVRLAGDSTFHDVAHTYADVTSSNAKFGVRYTDERSGFDVGGTPQSLRITRLAKTGPTCALGTATCGFVGTLGDVESLQTGFETVPAYSAADPRFRRDTVAIFGTLTDNTAGYYTYETYVTDRAGNRSVTVTKKAAIDIDAPNITGITVPAILTGGQPATFTPTGTDDLEVISGDLGIHYAAGAGLGGASSIRWRRQIFPQYDAPWNLSISTPIGPGAQFGAGGLTIPGGFITRIETVAAADSSPDMAIANVVRNADGVSAHLFDIKRYSKWLAADSASAYGLSVSSMLSAPIFVGNLVTADTTFYDRPLNTTKVYKFYVESYTNSVVKVTAVGPTVAINPPFQRIEIVRFNNVSGEYDVVVGTLGAPVPNDQGANRFYTWTFTLSTSGAGAGQNVFATGDIVRAIGVDANGNGLSTPDMTLSGVVPPTP